MEARNRSLPEWFERIRTRQIQLPRFQRFEAWGPGEVSDLLQTVLRGLPAGAALILEVGDQLPFISRSMATAPEQGERVTELLLDGQQRMTALWRSLNATYEDRTYFVRVVPQAESSGQTEVVSQPRWRKNGKLYPVWANTPLEVWSRGLIPLHLLRPGDINAESDDWIDSIVGDDNRKAREIGRLLQSLRERVATFNLPFLSLPTTTPREIALDVFTKLNTSSVKLTTFDILVAQVEAETDQSLHDLLADLTVRVPAASSYGRVENLVLDIAALLQDKAPNQSGYWRLDLARLVCDWEQVINATAWMVSFLEEQAVYDSDRLPTNAVPAVIAALWPSLPTKPDMSGNARILLRKYVWRAFLTSRYEQAAATATFNDFRALRGVLAGESSDSRVPLFDEELFPKPDPQQLLSTGWPKGRGILSRGMLALSLRAGAYDIADGAPISRSRIPEREYHHLFPASLLREAGVPGSEIFCALNCALVTWKTNRAIGAKEPLQYLCDRASVGTLGEVELRRRLKSHLIEYDDLAVGGYESAPDRADLVRRDYRRFLERRAELLRRAIDVVWSGQEYESSLLAR